MVKSVLVTGTGGYIGRYVVKSPLGKGLEAKALDICLEGVDEHAERVSIDLFSGNTDIYEQMGYPDAVLHMAWRDGFKHNSPVHLDDLVKHYHLVENLYADGLKQLAVMGTMHEVGYWEGSIDESSPCAPASLHGIAKSALCEAATLSAQSHGVTLQWICAYYIVGDDKFGNSIFPKLLSAAEEEKTSFPFTSGKSLYDFISVGDLSNQIATILDQDGVVGIIDACAGQPMPLVERVEGYIKDNTLGIPLEYGAPPDRPYDSPGVWGDVTKIRQILKADHRFLGHE